MELPRVHYMPFSNSAADHQRLRQCVQWVLVAFCFAITIIRLETPCNSVHKALNDIEIAKAEFHGLRLSAELEPFPEDPDWCTAKVRDVSSWVRAQPGTPPFSFPKIIHQTVEDKHNISCEVLECMQTWKDMNPGYEHRLYDAADREAFVAKHYPEVLMVYRSLSTNVERADMWRYLALHRHGGVYADSDVRCTQPIGRWNAVNSHDADLLVGVVYTDKQGMVTRVNNFIIAAMPCHPVMAAMPFTTMSRIAAAGLQGKPVGGETGQKLSEAVIGRTGPAALTATIGDYAQRMGAQWPVNGTYGAQGKHAGDPGPGNLVSTVRLMPRNIMTMGWETAAEKITCEEALKRNPGAYICHQYFGTWKATYNHRPALTYQASCRYWGLNSTEPAAAAAAAATGGTQAAAAGMASEVAKKLHVKAAAGPLFGNEFEQQMYEQQQQDDDDDDDDEQWPVHGPDVHSVADGAGAEQLEQQEDNEGAEQWTVHSSGEGQTATDNAEEDPQEQQQEQV